MATTNFPTSLDAGNLANPGPGDNTAAPSHSDIHSIVNDAIKALEAKLGISAATPTSTNILRGNGVGTSTWGKLVLSTDVTGTLGVANGGTGGTTSTGSGAVVLTTSPTIATPTIASFVNATHTHANAAGGGMLNGANSIQTDTITASQIANRIRWATFNKASDNTGGVVVSQNEANEIAFTGTPSAFGRLDLLIPQDYVSGTTATVNLVIFSGNTNNQSINYNLSSRASSSTFASYWNIQNNITTGSTINLSTNLISTFPLYTIAAANLAAGSLIAIAFRPSSAITGTIFVTEAYLSYTADM